METKKFVLLLGRVYIFIILVFSRIPVSAVEGWQHPTLLCASSRSSEKLSRSVTRDEQRLQEEG